MKSIESYLESYIAVVQSHVPDEQVLAVGLVAPVGSQTGGFVGLASPLAGMIMRKKAKNSARGFPHNVVMAVTPTRLVSFEYKLGNRLKVVRPLVEWPRDQVRVERGDKPHVLRFWFPDSTSVELECLRSIGSYGRMNDPFLLQLGLPV